MSSDSTAVSASGKPPRLRPNNEPSGSLPTGRPKLKKPRPDFPLSIHKGSGTWCKKVRGRDHYFGNLAADPKGIAALEEWSRVKEDLLAGKEPRAKSDGLTVAELCNQFLDHKERLRDRGELSPRTWAGYHATCATIVATFGKGRVVTDIVPDDFHKLRSALGKTRQAVALRNEMQRVRSVFKFAFDDGLIIAPVRFGQSFVKPKLDVVRRAREAHRAKHGDRMFEAADIRAMLDGKTMPVKDGEPQHVPGASQPLKAMILLAANTGFGQTDLAALPTRAVDLDSGWVDFARVKTAVRRRIPLWPETVAAIREWLKERPPAKDPADAGLLFLTCRGARWVKVNTTTGSPKDAIGQEFGKLLNALDLKRPGVAFYALRHGFETIAGETADQVAVDSVMGHIAQNMAGHYRERISDDRLRRVVEFVRQWLLGNTQNATPPDTDAHAENPIRLPLPAKSEAVASDDAAPALRLFVG